MSGFFGGYFMKREGSCNLHRPITVAYLTHWRHESLATQSTFLLYTVAYLTHWWHESLATQSTFLLYTVAYLTHWRHESLATQSTFLLYSYDNKCYF